MLAAISPDSSDGVDVRPDIDLALWLTLQSLLKLEDDSLKQRLLATRRHVTYEMTNWIFIGDSLCQYLITIDARCFGQITVLHSPKQLLATRRHVTLQEDKKSLKLDNNCSLIVWT